MSAVGLLLGKALVATSALFKKPTKEVRKAKVLSAPVANFNHMVADSIHFETIHGQRVTFYSYAAAGMVKRIAESTLDPVKGSLHDAIEQTRKELLAPQSMQATAVMKSEASEPVEAVNQEKAAVKAAPKVSTASSLRHEQAQNVQEEYGAIHDIGKRWYDKSDGKFMADFIEITLSNGQIVEFSGVDIPRAYAASNAKLGDYVRIVKSQANVTVPGKKPRIKNLYTIEVIKKKGS